MTGGDAMQTTQLDRINLRTTHETKTIIEQAAELMGTSLSAFMLSHAYEAARRVINEQQFLTLSNRDRDAFVAALENSPKPNKALRDLLKR